MKNVNVCIDVDLTVVDDKGQILEGARAGLLQLKEAGCHLFLWSNAGMEYARTTAARFHLSELFAGYAPKPDIVIDDAPATILNPFVFNPHEEKSWPEMAARIIDRHVD